MTDYRIEPIENLYMLHKYRNQFQHLAKEISECFGNVFNIRNFDIERYLENPNASVVVAWKGKEVVGCYLARLVRNVFDDECVMLTQDLIYVRPGHPKAARLLFQDLVAFGKENANHVITCVTSQTNISERSLEKRGFKKLETLYRLETT